MYKYKFFKTLGIIIVCFFIYRFLLLERLPYDINANVPYFNRFIVLSIIIFNLIELKSLFGKSNKVAWYKRIFIVIYQMLYINPLSMLRDSLLQYNPIKVVTSNFGLILQKLSISYNFIQFYVISFVLLPRLFLIYPLYLDICLLEKIAIFYNFLWLFLIIVIFKITISFIKEYYHTQKVYIMENHLEIRETESGYLCLPTNNCYDTNYQYQVSLLQRSLHILEITAIIDSLPQTYLYKFIQIITIFGFIFLWVMYIYKIFMYALKGLILLIIRLWLFGI